MSTTHPYAGLDPRAFWRRAVADRHFLDMDDLASPISFSRSDKVATAGSCFAQHIGRYLQSAGANYMDLEPRPGFLSEEEGRRHGFGLFSCRYGNVYTARQMLQLALEAYGQRDPSESCWEREGRFFDALRPSVDPVGHATPDAVGHLRRTHLAKVRQMLDELDVFVFTLGLTEAWESVEDGTVFPTAPGTVAGAYDSSKYRFRNFSYMDVRDDLEGLWTVINDVNPKARMVLTVSPVPLIATYSGDHVLVATTQSKATLRAVAGDLARDEGIHYFPSFEIISTTPSRAMFFNPGLRTVNDAGVQHVMKHFARAAGLDPSQRIEDPLDPICDEGQLERYS